MVSGDKEDKIPSMTEQELYKEDIVEAFGSVQKEIEHSFNALDKKIEEVMKILSEVSALVQQNTSNDITKKNRIPELHELEDVGRKEFEETKDNDNLQKDM